MMADTSGDGAQMKYNLLGSSDLRVSRCCLGTMTWGQQNTLEEGVEQLNVAFDECGINFIDTVSHRLHCVKCALGPHFVLLRARGGGLICAIRWEKQCFPKGKKQGLPCPVSIRACVLYACPYPT